MEEVNPIQPRRRSLRTSVRSGPQSNGRDYINLLPDDILIQILDKLPFEDALPTCLLAKRWRHLWRYMTHVTFDGNWMRRTGTCVYIGAKLFKHRHRSSQIERLSFSLRYGHYMEYYVNDWILSAINKRVKEIYIDLNGAENKRKLRKHPDFSLLPDGELKSKDLVKLSFKFMQLEMRPTDLPALMELHLVEVQLEADVVEMLTAKCKLLKLLSLTNCNANSDLKIKVSQEVKSFKLVIDEDLAKVHKQTELSVDVSSVISIDFASALPRRKYHIIGIPVAVEVKFSLDRMSHSRGAVKVVLAGGILWKQFSESFFHLFGVFQTADVLSLRSWCIQLLALEIIFKNDLCPSSASHLILEMGLNNVELIGLVYLLRACKELKKISINISKPMEFHFVDGLKNTYWSGSRYAIGDFEGNPNYIATDDLPNLEVVEISNYSADFENHLWVNGCFYFDEARFLKETEGGVKMLSLLKAKAPNLQKIVFASRKCRCEIEPHSGFHSFSARI